MKKEMNNIVVYLCMVLLLVFIAVPPLLRQFVPKEEIKVNVEKKKIVLLTCNKTSDDGQYSINTKSKFNNGEASTVTITYKLKETIPEEPTNNGEQNTQTDPNVVETNPSNTEGLAQTTVAIADPAIAIFRNLVDADVKEDANSFSVVMTSKTLSSNSEIKDLNNYFNVLSNQRKYYESLGFTCTKLES